MNDNLKNFTSEPDPKVWDNINKTLRKGFLRRQLWTAVVGVAVVAAAITSVVLWPKDTQDKAQASTNTEVTTEVAAQTSQEEAMPATAVDNKLVCENHVNATNAQKTVTQSQVNAPVMNQPKVAQEVAPVTNVVSKSVAAAEPKSVAVQTKEETKTSTVTSPKVEQQAPQTATPISTQVAQKKNTTKVTNSNLQDTILWIPNAFAPASGEEELMVFRAKLNKSGESISNFKMVIFNRGGHQVFTSHDINYGWDGTYKGSPLPQASYVYVISYSDKDGLVHQRKGTVTLIR